MIRRRCILRPFTVAAICFLLPAGSVCILPAAFAQQSPPDPRSNPPGLAPEPIESEMLGLTMRPPAGSNVQFQQMNGQTTIALAESDVNASWSMRIQAMASSLEEPTPEKQIDYLLAQRRNESPALEVLLKEPITVDQRAGQICYVRYAVEADQQLVSGWLLIPQGDRAYLIASMLMRAEHFDRLEPLFRASFQTMKLQDRQVIEQRQESRLETGQSFLDGLTEARLRELVGRQEIYRYYQPRVGGLTGIEGEPDQEIGWALVLFEEAPRGALNPARKPGDYQAIENELGLMVRIYGRIIDNPREKIYLDTETFYWMAWDQSEEAWSLRSTIRSPRGTKSSAETGLRTGPHPIGHLNVLITNFDGTNEDPKDWRTPEVYLSQPIKWALGALLPRDAETMRTFSYACYDSATGRLTQRVDEWGRDSPGGHWKLVTRATPDAPEVITLYDTKGRLIKRTLPNNTLTEAITLNQLHDLWRRKGLETGKIGR